MTLRNYREYRTDDKSSWARGPWDSEPDKVQWIDAETGLDCLIVRNGIGSLCGYVGVPESHPWHGRDYDEVHADVHGGLTFSSPCAGTGDESRGICHVPEPGRPDHVWWFGFDCAHAYDLSPNHTQFGLYGRDDVYRDLEYVTEHVGRLASQLTEVRA